MNVLVYLVPMAVGLGLIGLIAFLWALRSGQYSDVEGAALRSGNLEQGIAAPGMNHKPLGRVIHAGVDRKPDRDK